MDDTRPADTGEWVPTTASQRTTATTGEVAKTMRHDRRPGHRPAPNVTPDELAELRALAESTRDRWIIMWSPWRQGWTAFAMHTADGRFPAHRHRVVTPHSPSG